MSQFESVLEELRNRWRTQGVPLRPGASAAALHAFESKRQVCLPADIVHFYRTMDGMKYGSADGDFNYFWPLDEIESVPEILSGCRGIPDYGEIGVMLPDAAEYFVFADHSIWLNVFALRLSRERADRAPVIGICGPNWWPVSDSFEEMLRKYAADPMSILSRGE